MSERRLSIVTGNRGQAGGLRARTTTPSPGDIEPSLARPRRVAPRSAEYVEDITTTDLITVGCGTHATEALRIAETAGVRHLLVARDTELLGVLCTCDLMTSQPGAAVSDVMSRPPITISLTSPIDLAAVIMRWHSIACLPVLHHGRLIGVVTRRDLRSVGHANLEPRCQRCGADRHVRAGAGTGPPVCVRCRRAG